MSHFDEERARTYDAGARTYMPGYEALHQMARASLTSTIDIQEPARVLLLGVGTGYEAQQLQATCPSWELIGVDPSAPMLAVARGRLGAAADLRTGVLDDFDDLVDLDGVLSVGVLHHLDNREAQETLVKSLGRRLRSGGTLVLGCQVGPYRLESPRTQVLRANWRLHGHTAEEIEERTRAFMTGTIPPEKSDLDRWWSEAGLTSPEATFRIAYFQLLVAYKT